MKPMLLLSSRVQTCSLQHHGLSLGALDSTGYRKWIPLSSRKSKIIQDYRKLHMPKSITKKRLSFKDNLLSCPAFTWLLTFTQIFCGAMTKTMFGGKGGPGVVSRDGCISLETDFHCLFYLQAKDDVSLSDPLMSSKRFPYNHALLLCSVTGQNSGLVWLFKD